MAEAIRQVPSDEFKSTTGDELVIDETTDVGAVLTVDNRVTDENDLARLIAADDAQIASLTATYIDPVQRRRDKRQAKLDRVEAAKAGR